MRRWEKNRFCEDECYHVLTSKSDNLCQIVPEFGYRALGKEERRKKNSRRLLPNLLYQISVGFLASILDPSRGSINHRSVPLPEVRWAFKFTPITIASLLTFEWKSNWVLFQLDQESTRTRTHDQVKPWLKRFEQLDGDRCILVQFGHPILAIEMARYGSSNMWTRGYFSHLVHAAWKLTSGLQICRLGKWYSACSIPGCCWKRLRSNTVIIIIGNV